MDDLGSEEGLDDFKIPTTIALIDCDTIVYAAASVSEYADDLLDEDMYTKEEWAEILLTPNYDSDESCIWIADFDRGLELCKTRIQDIMVATETGSAELYFTTGRNFRYTVDPMYKANRKNTRYPVGMKELKEALVEEYGGEICSKIEADDAVCYLKRNNPLKYVLCAVDKDVYKSVTGRHYNYYYSSKYNIKPKFVNTSKEDAEAFPYLQTLMGDSTDNIAGCPGIGPKKAESALAKCSTAVERWDVVCKLYIQKKLTVKDAIRNMRLVSMNQIIIGKDGKLEWNPWTPPLGE